MKRIAGNIAGAFFNAFKGKKTLAAADTTRYYDTDPRESRTETSHAGESNEGSYADRSAAFERAYAGRDAASIQLC